MFRYRIARFLLILGVVFGYGSGFASLAWHARHGGCHGGAAGWHETGWRDAYREELKAELAEACIAAARRAPPPPAAVAPTVIPLPYAVPVPQGVPAPVAAVPTAPTVPPATAPPGT